MKKNSTISRNKNIIVRVSAKEKEALTRMAKSKGISLSDFVRQAIHRRPFVNLRQSRRLFNYLDIISTEINRIGNNINQAVHAIHLSNKTGSCSNSEVTRFNELFEKYLAKRDELVKGLDRFYNQQK